MTKAVFFDKDGTLIKDVPYNIHPSLIKLVPGSAQLVRALKNSGFKIVVVTNQSGVAKGFFSEAELGNVSWHLNAMLDGMVDGFYYCPHHPQGAIAQYAIYCECRKPQPGLLLKAAQDLEIDLKHSWLIGDILNDIEAGKAAGCQTILLDCGGETEWKINSQNMPDYICQNLAEAEQIILPNKSKINRQRREELYHGI